MRIDRPQFKKEIDVLVGEQFKPYTIKEYQSWSLVLSEKQFYIGRCYAWWRDTPFQSGEGLRLSQIHLIAREELTETIAEDVIRACKALGYPTESYGSKFLLNQAYLANEMFHNHQLHYHFIPRTAEPFEVPLLHINMDDTQWGHIHFGPERSLPQDQMLAIRQMMAQAIG